MPEYNIDELDLEWLKQYPFLQDPEIKSDVLTYNYNIGNIAPDIDINMTITKGRYNFTFSNASGQTITKDIERVLICKDDYGNDILKRYQIEKMSVNPQTKDLTVQVNVIDNPIPLIVIYGAVFVVCATVAALTSNSILTKVETVTMSFFNSPATYLIIGIFLIPIVLPLFKK